MELDMKKEIKRGLEIADEFTELGAACLDFASRMRSLITMYSDEEIQLLTEYYKNNIAPKIHLLQEPTTEELLFIIPIIKELYEINDLLKLIPRPSILQEKSE